MSAKNVGLALIAPALGAFLFLQCLVMPAIGRAQAVPAKPAAPACPEDLKPDAARALLEKVQSAFKSVDSIRADFIQRSYLSALDQSEQSRGEVLFLKPGKMKWQYAMPEKQVFLLKDQTVWLYQPELNQVLVDGFDKVLISDLPVAFLMGLGNLLEDFQIEKACRSPQGVEFALLPGKGKDHSQGELRQFTLMVDSDKFLPQGAKVVDISGNITSISLSSLKPNPKDLSASDFELALPDGVDTIDRRQQDRTGKDRAADGLQQ